MAITSKTSSINGVSSVSEDTEVKVSQTGALRTTRLRQIVFFASLLVLWELISRSGIWPDYLFPGPVAVSQALISGLRKGLYLQGVKLG